MAILLNLVKSLSQHAMDWRQCDDIGDLPDDMCYHLFFSEKQAEVWFYVLCN